MGVNPLAMSVSPVEIHRNAGCYQEEDTART